MNILNKVLKDSVLVRLFSITFLILLLSFCGRILAASTEPNEPNDLFEMSLEELMEVPVVVSASRQEHKITESSTAISIVTAEEIHNSGQTNLPEILQFKPGMDVLRFNRNNYAVGVRGLHDILSDRVLSLVDGRIADNPAYGGPEFTKLPLFLEDIDRVEIVRGPGGSVWGANAFTGVINIITKDPKDVLGSFASSTMNEHGDSFTHLRYAEQQDKLRWKISLGYEQLEDSDDAGAGKMHCPYGAATEALIGYSGYYARDFSRTWKLDSSAIYDASDETRILFGAGYANVQSGDYEQAGYFPMKDNRDERLRTYTKIERQFDDGSSGYLQYFFNRTNMNWRPLGIIETYENDIEAQYSFSPAEDHKMTIGSNFRWTRLDTSRDNANQTFHTGEPYDEHWSGAYVVDRWQYSDRVTLEGQFRGDWYEETGLDWSGRLSWLYALDEKKDHVLRISAARAFRAPLISLRDSQVRLYPVGGGLYAINSDKPDELHNEHTWSLETGYSGRIAPGLTVFANTYYQRFEHLIGNVSYTDIFGFTHADFDNLDGADSWGSELELMLEGKTGKCSIWYAFNDFHCTDAIRASRPAKNKIGLTGQLYLDENWTFNTNYKFNDVTIGDSFTGVNYPSFQRLDCTVSRKIAKGNGEIMFGVSDVLNKTNAALMESSCFTGHETPGRTFFARLQWRF